MKVQQTRIQPYGNGRITISENIATQKLGIIRRIIGEPEANAIGQ